MMNNSIYRHICTGCLLILFSGCSLQPHRYVKVKTDRLKANGYPRLIDPNDSRIRLVNPADPNAKPLPLGFLLNTSPHSSKSKTLIIQSNAKIQMKNPVNIPYLRDEYRYLGHVAVKGAFHTEQPCRVFLDTGSGNTLQIKSSHVLKNHLAIFPLASDSDTIEGFSYIPKLHIGSIAFVDHVAMYEDNCVQFQIFGIPVFTRSYVNIGLSLLQQFKYILFDNNKQRVTISAHAPFEPDDPNRWIHYPFSIKDKEGVALLVKIPIAGKDCELLYDSCCSEDLMLSQSLWETLPESIRKTKLRPAIVWTPGYQGSFKGKKGKIEALDVGESIAKNVDIFLLHQDDHIRGCDGVMGLSFFGRTSVVLDFERNFMRVKQ